MWEESSGVDANQYNVIRNVRYPGFPPMFIDLYCDRSATTVLTAAAWNMRQQHLFEESLVWIKMRGTHSSKTEEKWKMKRVRCTFTFPGTRRCLGLRIPLTLKGTTALDSLPPCCMFSNLIRLLHTHYFYFLRRLPHNHYSTVFYWQKCRWSLDSRLLKYLLFSTCIVKIWATAIVTQNHSLFSSGGNEVKRVGRQAFMCSSLQTYPDKTDYGYFAIIIIFAKKFNVEEFGRTS